MPDCVDMWSMSILLIYELLLFVAASDTHLCKQEEHTANTNLQNQFAFDDGYTEANRWRTFDNWNCNLPPATSEGFQIAAVVNSRMGHFTNKTSGVLLFGGLRYRGEESTASDTWFFDMKEQLWSRIETKPNPPPRRNPIMISLCDDMIVLIGGKPLDCRVDTFCIDVWIFNTTSSRWTEVKLKEAPAHPPPSIYESSAAVLPLRDSPCKCHQSVIVTEKKGNWASLWTLYCLQDQDQHEYQWRRVSNDDSVHSPITNIALTAVAANIGKIYGLTKDSLWERSSLNTSWKRIHSTNILQRPDSTHVDDMAYLNRKEGELILFSTTNATLIVHNFTQKDKFRWGRMTAAGNMPIYLHSMQQSRLHNLSRHNCSFLLICFLHLALLQSILWPLSGQKS